MKLHELDTLNQQDKAAQVLEQRLGQTVSFSNLTLRESRHMLLRVRGLINEHRSSAASHSSERDPAYLKLLMLESGLKGRLKENTAPPIVLPSDQKYTQALVRVYGQPILRNPKFPDLMARLKQATPNERDLDIIIKTGTLPNHLEEVAPVMPGQAAGTMPATGTVAAKPGQPVAAPVNLKDPKLVAATKKAQSGQTLNPQEKEMMAAAGAAAVAMQKESVHARRRLRESEIQQAQVVLAAQDMVDQVQKMLEQISAMQFKDLPALTDSIKNDMGVEQATAYQSAAAAALTQLLAGVQQGKTALEGAQGTLTGQAPVVPGEELGADMGADLNAEPGMDAELDVDAEVAPAGDDEEPTPLGAPEALGRERRVAEAAKKGKKPDFLDVDKDGNKKEPFKKAVADKKAGVDESMDQPMSKILAKGYTSSQEHGDKQPRMSAKQKEASKAARDARDAADMKKHFAKHDAEIKAAAKKK